MPQKANAEPNSEGACSQTRRAGPLVEQFAEQRRDIIVMAASSGGLEVLRALCRHLPKVHIGDRQSRLPEIMSWNRLLPVLHPRDGELARPGKIYVAPPDRHLVLDAYNVLRPWLSAVERNNGSAAGRVKCSLGSSVSGILGVVLSGGLTDGTAGMLAIKANGGIAVVQKSDGAEAPQMPNSVMQNVDVDFCVDSAELGPNLVALARQ